MTLPWSKYLRQRDLYQLIDSAPVSFEGDVLEIGCGDGHLSTILSDHFNNVISTDINPREEIKDVIVADAQYLPFTSNTFDAIFSSNVLEHIDDLPKCLNELHRVSKKDVIMLHTMPTVWWKLFQFLTHYIYLIKVLARKVFKSKSILSTRSHNSNTVYPQVNKRILIDIWPSVHGVSKNHIQEINAFSSNTWEKLFQKYGFKVIKKETLFVHSPYRIFPYRFLWLRKFISKLGVSSVKGYWVIKNND